MHRPPPRPHRLDQQPQRLPTNQSDPDRKSLTLISTPNFYRLEIAYSELDYYNAALTPPLDVRNGFYHVSTLPGLGHELKPDYVEAGADKSLID